MKEQEKVFKYLETVEKLAEEIVANKFEIIMLDKRRNHNREALRELTKSSACTYWITVGSVLVEYNKETTKSLLEADQNQLDIDINKLRSELKVKVNNLRDLEMQSVAPGHTLKPLDQDEIMAMSKAHLI